MKQYLCNACKYLFRDYSRDHKVCPHCNSPNIEVVREIKDEDRLEHPQFTGLIDKSIKQAKPEGH